MRERVVDFKGLKVWQMAMDLAESCYRLARSLPVDERFGLALQLRRSSVSVASNIAEGFGRRSRKEFVRFLNIANGSLKEVATQILLARRLEPTGLGSEAARGLNYCEQLGRMFTVLTRRLNR